mgnify:CR=1 FL=1
MNNKEKAYLYFWPELKGRCKEGWVLHHKDPSWKTEDPERYKQWNVEDLIPLTVGEHTTLHCKGKPSGRKGKHISEKPEKEKKKKETMSVFRPVNKEFYQVIHTVSEESRKKMSESLKGRISWMKGKHHTQESNKKNSEAHKGMLFWNNGID